MGCAAAACGLDSGENGAQHRDVRAGLDADVISAGADGPESSTELLRRECVVVIAGVDLARLPVSCHEP